MSSHTEKPVIRYAELKVASSLCKMAVRLADNPTFCHLLVRAHLKTVLKYFKVDVSVALKDTLLAMKDFATKSIKTARHTVFKEIVLNVN